MSEEGGNHHHPPPPKTPPSEKKTNVTTTAVSASSSPSSANTAVSPPAPIVVAGAGATAPAPAAIITSVDAIRTTEITTAPKLAPAPTYDEPLTPANNGAATPIPWAMRHVTSFDIDNYFTGPRDTGRHSKWPVFLQMHGSVLPKMILPLIFMGGWATGVTLISKYVYNLGVQSTLLTVLGLTVSLALSFRSSTAYERYNEGRKYWQSMIQCSQALGRIFWIHAKTPEGRDPREILLKKASAMQLILAFALSVKHKLRFEPYTSYEDLQQLVAPLTTFAGAATAADPTKAEPVRKNMFKETGEYLGLSFAQSNPRKMIKKSQQPLGNLPLEIINYLAVTIDQFIADGQLPVPMMQTLAYNNLAALNDTMTGTERILNTPLPIAYTIAIAQITWVYVLLLPFQLYNVLDWITIPATFAAAYIILGFLMIGTEIENPFGSDVNDLPLEMYCEQIACELDIIASHDVRAGLGFMEDARNMPLYPVSTKSYHKLVRRSEEKLREAIRTKHGATFENKLAMGKKKRSASPDCDDMV
jgi:putative membrane protein